MNGHIEKSYAKKEIAAMNRNALSRLLEEKDIKLKGGLYHYMQVKFAYNSNKIEGGALDEDEIRFIYELNTIYVSESRIVKVDDIVEAKNHFRCFDYMLESAKEPLSENIIKEYHRLLKRGTSDSEKEWFNVGGYKKIGNTVAGIMTTPPPEVGNEMQKLIGDYTQKGTAGINDIVDFHYRFERIHPFQDGNGRVGRLIMFKECLRNNIAPFVIHDENKGYYYRGLGEYANTQKYLRKACLDEQDRCGEILDYFKINYAKRRKRRGSGEK
jgi:Fic family protein